MAIERTAKAGVVALVVIGPNARVIAEIYFGRIFGPCIGGGRVGGSKSYFSRLKGGLAVGCVAHFIDRTADKRGTGAFKARIVALVVIGPRARIVAEIDVLGQRWRAKRKSEGERGAAHHQPCCFHENLVPLTGRFAPRFSVEL